MMKMIIMTMINVLNVSMVIRNERLKKPQQKKGSYLLLSIHQDGGIGVFLKMKSRRQKNYGGKYRLFCV